MTRSVKLNLDIFIIYEVKVCLIRLSKNVLFLRLDSKFVWSWSAPRELKRTSGDEVIIKAQLQNTVLFCRLLITFINKQLQL
jgi:hypothetical protein